MVGIGGAGMSGVARILLDRGGLVSGSDAKESRGVVALRARVDALLARIALDVRGVLVQPGQEAHVAAQQALVPRDDVGADGLEHRVQRRLRGRVEDRGGQVEPIGHGERDCTGDVGTLAA